MEILIHFFLGKLFGGQRRLSTLKVEFFVWCAAQGKILTVDNLIRHRKICSLMMYVYEGRVVSQSFTCSLFSVLEVIYTSVISWFSMAW